MKYGQWDDANLEQALAALDRHEGVNKVARSYGVPKATLLRHYHKRNAHGNGTKSFGRPPTLLAEVEEELKNHILLMEERMFGLTPTEIRELAFDVAEQMQPGQHPFNERAGKKWYYNFLRRFPELSLRTPELTSMARIKGFSRTRVKRFFEKLTELADKFHFGPEQVFNVDETGISTVQKTVRKIVGQRGKRQVGGVKSAERGTNSTAVCCVNVTGNYVPPMLNFKMSNKNQKEVPSALEIGKPRGSIVRISDSGYIHKELFLEWLRHFKNHINCSIERPVLLLLLLNGHTTHLKNLQAINFCRENGIVMLQLPSHTTHRLQPLDVAFFGPLQGYLASAQKGWLIDNPGKTISIYQISTLFKDSYYKAATLGNAESAFRGTDIWPIDMLRFPEHAYAAADAMNAGSEAENGRDDFDVSNVDEVNKDVVYGATSDVEPNPQPKSSSVKDVIQKISSVPRVPTTSSGKKKRGRPLQEAEELTSSPYKNKLEERERTKT